MKIAIDLTSFNKDFKGGKEQVVCNLMQGFTEISPETKLLLFCYEEYVEKARKLAPHAELIVFKRLRIKKLLQDLLIRTFLIKKHLSDCDILFFPMYYTGFARFDIPTVVLPHDIQFKTLPGNFSWIERIKDSVLYKSDFRLRSKIIAISEFYKKEIREFYPEYSHKIKKIYNPILGSGGDADSRRSHLLAINIGFTHKNVSTLIKAYKLIEDECDLPLYLTGKSYDGIAVNEIIQELKLQEKVKYLGHVPHDKLQELLKDAYAYITPSTYEGFGMPSVEAMLFRVPVVSSKQPALYEVTFGKAKYYESYTDEKALADSIRSIMRNYPDDGYLDELKERALREYNYRKISENYLTFFEELGNRVVLADPMSYHNLALYDSELLGNIKGLDVTFAGNEKYDLYDELNIFRLYNYSAKKIPLFKAISYIRSQLRLCRLIKKHRIKVLHLQWSRIAFFDYLLIKRMKRRFGLKFIYTSHDVFSHNLENTHQSAFLRLMGTADRIIVHTEKSAKILKQHGFTNIAVIHHGLLDIMKAYPPEEVDFTKDDRIVFSQLGYMEKYKGTDLLLKAWLSSPKLMGMGQLHLVVAGVSRLDFVPEIPEGGNVTFIDELLSDGAFTKWMDLSDVVVLPYQKISQSGLMLTALSMNKLLAVNDVGEIAAPVRKYGVGWVMNAYDVQNLRKELEIIADDIIDNGLLKTDDTVFEDIRDDLSWEKAGEMTKHLYLELMEEK